MCVFSSPSVPKAPPPPKPIPPEEPREAPIIGSKRSRETRGRRRTGTAQLRIGLNVPSGKQAGKGTNIPGS